MIAMAIAFAIPLSAQTEVTVGDESSTVRSFAPIDLYYGNTYSQVIYLSSELQSGLISQISYYWLEAFSGSYPVTLYMGETTQTSFELNWESWSVNFVPSTDLTQVYNGTVTFNQGWVTITLDTPFAYTGTNNLVVGVLSNRGMFEDVLEASFKGTFTDNTIMAAYISNDEIAMNPATPSLGDPFTIDTRPNTKFTISGLEGFCYPVSDLQANSVTQTSANITWTSDESSTTFGLDYREVGQENWVFVSSDITGNSYSLSELSAYTTYEVKVYSICDDGNSTDRTVTFTTAPSDENIVSIPYQNNFDLSTPASEWYMENNGVNVWVIGSGANNTYTNGTLTNGGALYISNNNGYTNSYNTNLSGSSYAYTLVNLEEGLNYGLEFDYRVAGEGYSYDEYDYAQVFLLPLDTQLPAVGLPASGQLTEKLFSQSLWNSSSTLIPNEYVGYYKLVFAWTNDDVNGENPPIAIDNIRLFSTSCQRVEQMSVSAEENGPYVTMTIEIEDAEDNAQYRVEYRLLGTEQWTSVVSNNPIALDELAFSSQYEVKITTICGTEESVASEVQIINTPCGVGSVPYTEGFETIFEPDGVIGSRFAPQCWYIVNGGDQYNYYFETEGDNPSSSYDGDGYLSFQGFYSMSEGNFVMSDWAISPAIELTGNERLNFQMTIPYYDPNGIIPVVEVYALNVSENDITSAADTSLFTLIEVIRHEYQDDEYHEYEVGLTQFTGATRFAFAVRGYTGSFYIDGVTVSELPPCPDVFLVSAQAASTTSAKITFSTSNSNGNGWVVAYGEAGDETFIPEEAMTLELESADEVPFFVEGLTAGETYYFAVKQNCEEGVYSTPVQVTLPTQVRTMPFVENFDNITSTDWSFNGETISSTSTWFIGSAVNNTMTENETLNNGGALYVTSDGGVSNNYQVDAAANLYAMIPVQFNTASNFVLAFDWKAGGVGSEYYAYDYLSVHIVPLGGTVNDNNRISDKLFSSDGWEREEISLSSSYGGGVYNIVFKWQNEGYSGTQPAAAIDNISLTSLTCAPVSSVTVTNAALASSSALPSLNVDIEDEINSGLTYIIQYKADDEDTWTTITGIDLEDFPYNIPNLAFETTYSIKVGVNCGDGTFAAYIQAADVTTPCVTATAPWSETFTETPLESSCWAFLSGMLPESGSIQTSELSQGWWSHQTFTNPTRGALYTNVYDVMSAWAVTPSLELPSGSTYQITFDVALAAWSFTYDLSAPPTEAPDDVFAVLVSTDNGASWSAANGMIFKDGDEDTQHNFSDLTNSFTRYSYQLLDANNNPITGVVKFAFYTASEEFNGDNNLFISNITVEEYSTCQTPSLISVSATETTAVVSFNENGQSTQWQYVMTQGETVNTEDGIPVLFSETDLPLTVEGLNSFTTYSIAVRSVCGEGAYSSWSTPLTFTTQMEAEDLPYTCNFEQEGSNWSLNNGNSANKWYIGQLSSNNTANGALYVSSNNGTGATYSTGAASTVVAEKIFHTGTSDSLTFSFDINVGGDANFEWETYYDYLKVLWLPENIEILPAANGNVIFPESYVEYSLVSNTTSDNAKLVVLTNGTQTFTVTIPNEANTIKKLVFVWTNDSSEGNGIAPVIDNISISDGTVVPEPCDAPINLAVNNVSQTEATVTWNGSADSYEIKLNGSAAETVYGTTKTYTDLTSSTDYTVEVRAVCENDYSEWAEISFTTLAEEVVVTEPTVTTLAATAVTGNSATLNGTVIAGSEPITTQGFAVWVGENEPDYWFEVELGENMTYVMTDLAEATTYLFAAYAATGELGGEDLQTYMGETLSFMTTSGLADADLVRLTTVIYPNPASERATISIDGLSVGAEIRLTDQLGKTILVEELPSGTKTYEINTSTLTSGVYYVRISCGTAVNTQKLIVR